MSAMMEITLKFYSNRARLTFELLRRLVENSSELSQQKHNNNNFLLLLSKLQEYIETFS
jgi:hypothetical protein